MYRVSPRACLRRETKTDPFLSVIVILLLFLANANKSPENGRPSSQRAPVPSKWAHGTTPLHKITLLSVQNPQCTSVLFKEFISKMEYLEICLIQFNSFICLVLLIDIKQQQHKVAFDSQPSTNLININNAVKNTVPLFYYRSTENGI